MPQNVIERLFIAIIYLRNVIFIMNLDISEAKKYKHLSTSQRQAIIKVTEKR